MSHPGDPNKPKSSVAPPVSEEDAQPAKKARVSSGADDDEEAAEGENAAAAAAASSSSAAAASSSAAAVAAASLPPPPPSSASADLPASVHMTAHAARQLPSPPSWSADLDPMPDELLRERYVEWDLAAGRCMIQYACDHLYAPVEPYPQFTCLLKWRLGGADPIDYCNAYTTLDKKCWHYISMGFSQLYPFKGRDREYAEKVKGASFEGASLELTFRLVKRAGEDIAPMWPFQLMQKYGLQNKRGMNVYPGAIIATDGPVFTKWKTVVPSDGSASKDEVEFASTSEAFVLMDDPQLMPFANPYSGEPVYFLQMVGITKKELDSLAPIYHPAIAIEFVQRLMEEIQGNPLLTTDLSRQCSFVKDPVKARAILADVQAIHASMTGE